MAGIRLDSGDLAYLSIEARKILDAAGFPKVPIIASNDLDEHVIASLEEQGAPITLWGVGTRLVTGGDQSALGGVYKLGAVRSPGGPWKNRVKVSEQAIKVSNPGILQVRRYASETEFVADVIWDEEQGVGTAMIDPQDPTRRKRLPAAPVWEDLLVPVLRGGRVVYEPDALPFARQRVQDQLARFHSGVKRFVNPHRYPVGLEAGLHDLKTRLVLEARGVPA
jgi:nicotinate phosphoribosyltransferase